MNKPIVHKPGRDHLTPTELLPQDILELLGPPALVGSESVEQFYAMMCRFVLEFDPATISEWELIDSLVYLNFEIARYRRVKATFVQSEMQDVATGLSQKGSFLRRPDLLSDGGPMGEYLARRGFTRNQLAEATIAEHHETISKFDDLIGKLEIRRERIISELRGHVAIRSSRLINKGPFE